MLAENNEQLNIKYYITLRLNHDNKEHVLDVHY